MGEQSVGLVDKALQTVGLQKPPAVDTLAQLPPLPLHTSVTLRVHAGEVLNTDGSGRSLALVARVYKLKAAEAFLKTPYEAFQGDTARHKELPFGQDVLDVREVVLTPGQKLEGIEKLGLDAKAIAVVALFRAPAGQRWRFVFDTKAAASTGITLGVHACALSVAQGQPLDTPPENLRLAGVRCPA
jgi:type VI secretion system protein VasD